MENRANILRAMKICRFCLSEEGPLTNIYERQPKDNKQSIPLPLQLMACVAIEVFENDGMPQLICKTCRAQTQQAYTFKTNCKKADDSLKVFLATGSLSRPWSQEEIGEQAKAFQAVKRAVDKVEDANLKKIKQENPGVVTLNYSTNLSENDTSHEDMNESLEKPSYDSSTADEEQNDRMDDEDFMNLEEESVLNPTLKVNQCDRTFLTGEDLDAHTAKHKKKRPFMCKICQKSFVFKQGLERHEQTHSNVKPHKCNYCEASFTSAIKLTRHVTSHAGLRPYPCKLCGRTFLLSHHLTRHMRSHYAAQQAESSYLPPIGQHKCDICSMSFRRKDSLINHSAIHSMVNLKCVICNTEFDNVVKVKEHITTHLSDLPFPCDKCDYSFETQEQLEDHELKHAEMEYEEQIEQEVMAEARQAAVRDDEDNSDYSGDDIAEFTITNDMNNPEVVRRSKRVTKIKNYAEFLKDEIGSDVEEEPELEQTSQLQEQIAEVNEPTHEEIHEEDAIKPIVRTEGTKVYSRKSLPERPKPPQINLDQGNVAPLSKISQPINTLDHLSKQVDISKFPEKEVFNMKIGDKTVTVQKLLLTKEQMKAMAKEGKIEKKGNTLLLRKSATQSFHNVSLDSIFGSSKDAVRPQFKKTYQRKSFSSEEAGEVSSSVTLNEHLNITTDENM